MPDIKAPPLSPSLVKSAEFMRNVYAVSIPPSVPFNSVLCPEYWVHCTKTLKVGDHLECLAQDSKWYGELLVGKVGEHAVTVWPIRYVDLASQPKVEAQLPDPANYVVNLGGPQRWRVVRLSDKKVIHHGEATEDDAKAWLADFLKAPA
jgi:hypothetical protein